MNLKHTTVLALLFLVIFSFFTSCKKEDEKRFQTSWSSKDPIAIPYHVRMNERNLGNLVINSSFETGKVYYEESNIKSYDIDGWKKVGNNILWINAQNSEYAPDDVYNGSHAIKIVRNNADETEETGEGILSDYIKVIPGNYFLKLFLKLENICPNQGRLGTKMYDAVNIRIKYYDKNKIELNTEELNAFNNTKIDIGFKSLTLSNFWNIDEFGWGEVHGKTAVYPFFNGDMPDHARYVKIFIGLKGTGSMWIDDVDFHYTRENFTTLERLQPYFDSSYFATDMIFPQPKKVVEKEKIVYYDKDSALYPIIVIPQDASITLKKAIKGFKEQLVTKIKSSDTITIPKIEVVHSIDINSISKNQFILSIGDNSIYSVLKADLPDSIIIENKNSYYIHQLDSQPNIIFMNGADEDAIQNALYTAIQLFDSHSSNYYNANIIDYPDFYDRAYLLHTFNSDLEKLQDKIELLQKFKYNQVYFEIHDQDKTDDYPFKSINEIAALTDYSIMLDLNKLNAKLALKDQSSRFDYKKIIPKSAKTVLLAGDYYQEYVDCSPDKVVYSSNKDINDHLQFDHIKLLNEFSKYLNSRKIKTNIEFLPPWNRLDINDRGQGQAEFYYYDLNKNITGDIAMYWTGGTYCTYSIDYAEYFRISEMMGTCPVLFDNRLMDTEERFSSEFIKNFYAGKLRTLSLFEPYYLKTFNDLYKFSGNRKVLLNTEDLSELNTIRMLTAVNYYWNTKSYDPDKSLWIVLNKLYGRKSAISLLQFNDAYYGLNEICQKIEIDGIQYKNVRIAKSFASDLETYFKELKENVDNEDLLSKIEALKLDILKKFTNLTSTVK